jgi:very-short-patch-repair endonuclease
MLCTEWQPTSTPINTRPQSRRMNSIYYDVWRRGGVAATHELLRDGHTSHSLTSAVRRGEIIRARQGHYCCPELPVPQLRALRVGGLLTGLAAADAYGLWTPEHRELPVAVRTKARALRTPDDASRRLPEAPGDAVARWTGTPAGGTRSLVDPVTCLMDVAKRHPPLLAFAVVESALFHGVITAAAWRRALDALPATARADLASVGKKSESGGESQLKFHLQKMGVELQQQVRFRDVGRVDFLVGDGLIIEADGAEFHTSRKDFEEDRRRDALLAARGYRVLRFSYTQIVSHWAEVEAAIRAAIARGDHLHPRPLPK